MSLSPTKSWNIQLDVYVSCSSQYLGFLRSILGMSGSSFLASFGRNRNTGLNNSQYNIGKLEGLGLGLPMVSSINREPQSRPKYTVILLIKTARLGPLIFGPTPLVGQPRSLHSNRCLDGATEAPESAQAAPGMRQKRGELRFPYEPRTFLNQYQEITYLYACIVLEIILGS